MENTRQRPTQKLPLERFMEHHREMGRQFPVSALSNGSFPNTFNASGFHEDILRLIPGEKGYGVDNCVRHLDFGAQDADHKPFFMMGIFATSIKRERDPRGSFTDPGRHEQFFAFQKALVDQFFEFVQGVGVRREEMSVTFYDGGVVGSNGRIGGTGRDSALVRSYTLAPDVGGASAVGQYLPRSAMFPVRSILNVDINPVEGALVGPRIEVAVRGFEIATIVFDYFRIENGKLIPIDYIGGYAIGMERLQAAITPDGNLYSTGIMPDANRILDGYIYQREGYATMTYSPLMVPSVRQLISSTEAMLHLSRVTEEQLEGSKTRRQLLRQLKECVRGSARELAMEEKELEGFVREFAGLISAELQRPFGEVDLDVSLRVLRSE